DKMKINQVYIKREEKREQLREEAANMPFPATNGIQLIHGDFNGKSKRDSRQFNRSDLYGSTLCCRNSIFV
ncbi:MAG: hypothetical protein WA461_14175, partial [Nitrososphaeraceae archaeon]